MFTEEDIVKALDLGIPKNQLLSIPLGLSGDKIWREKPFLGLAQIEINLCALLSFCTKPRQSSSRQIFSRERGGDKPSGIDNTDS